MYDTENFDTVKNSAALERIKPVIEHIDKNYRSSITIAELSGIIGVSPQYLCRLFKKCLDMRPFEYLAERRIAQAKRLLAGGALSISEIAAAVGFNDCSYFCAVFKKKERISPTAYRGISKKTYLTGG